MSAQAASNRRDEEVLSKLSQRSSAALRALIDGPFAQEALARAEVDDLAQRSGWVSEISELDKAYPAEKKRASAAAANALQALEEAQARFYEARDASHLATMVDNGAELNHIQKRNAVIAKLTQTADKRLVEWIFHARQIVNVGLVRALSFWIDPHESQRQGSTVQRSNIDQVEAARTALNRTIADAQRMQLEPLGYAEVSQTLTRFCQELEPILARVELNAPTLSAEHAEIGAPLLWRGDSHWLVGEIVDPAREGPARGQAKEGNTGGRRA